MPSWELHDRWAKRVGLSAETSEFVNTMIDFPQKCSEFIDFCDRHGRIFRRGRPTEMSVAPFVKHDQARTNPWVRQLQVEFLDTKGDQYVTAFYLHQILDYVLWWTESAEKQWLPMEAILSEERLREKVGDPGDERLQRVLKVVRKRWHQLIADCRRQRSCQTDREEPPGI